MSLLDVRDLRIAFRQDGISSEAVKGVSFVVDKGYPTRGELAA